jgi:hypothetical protein
MSSAVYPRSVIASIAPVTKKVRIADLPDEKDP